MDIIAVASAGAAVIGTLFAIWYGRRADRGARSADARASEAHAMMREAHKMAKEAHEMIRGQHDREALEHEKRNLADAIVDQVYRRAAEHAGDAGLSGIALRAESELERSAALSLKGDPRVRDVTVEPDGSIRVWVDGSGFPNMQN